MIKSTIAKTPTDLERTIFQIYADGGKVVTTVALKAESIKGRSYMDVIEFMVFYEEPITIKVDPGQIAAVLEQTRKSGGFIKEVTPGGFTHLTVPGLPEWWPKTLVWNQAGKPCQRLPIQQYAVLPDQDRNKYNPECTYCGCTGRVMTWGCSGSKVDLCPAVGCVWKTQYE